MTFLTEPVRIAVAEDNPDFRQALILLLRSLGHDVVCEAGDGAELLSACFPGNVDLVIADLDMPHIDGLEAAEEIAKRGVPVILLSGHPDVEYVNLQHEPVAARLLKPATPDRLQAAIHHALEGRRRAPR
ncbi:MAG TPA: response regulator [Lacipirellulaceae bacterium]|nr:response regulator [Lacipirellulaceae bacterium]